RAAARIATCSWYSGSSNPGESVKMYWVSSRVSRPTTGRRVDCGLGETMARCSPTNALRREDFPTFGRPASTTVPQRVMTRKQRRRAETSSKGATPLLDVVLHLGRHCRLARHSSNWRVSCRPATHEERDLAAVD